MLYSEIGNYDPGPLPAIDSLEAAFHYDMHEAMLRGQSIAALRGAGTVNSMAPRAADMAVQLLSRHVDERQIFLFDGDPEPDPNRATIGSVAAGLRRIGALVIAVQTEVYHRPKSSREPVTTATGEAYKTYIIGDDEYPGNHSYFTQSDPLTEYPGFGLVIVGSGGTITSQQAEDYARKVSKKDRPVNIMVIKAGINEALDEEIGERLAQAVAGADHAAVERYLAQLNQRRELPHGSLFTPDGSSISKDLLAAAQRANDTHELAIVWDLDGPLETVHFLNCLKVDLFSPEFNKLFEAAPYFVKTRPIKAYQLLENTGRWVEGRSDASGDTAKPGDWICRKQNPDGTYGEEYVVYREDFRELYENEPIAGSLDIYPPKRDPRRLVELKVHTSIEPPWKGRQALRAGDFVLERVKQDGSVERYGIARKHVIGDFVPVGSAKDTRFRR